MTDTDNKESVETKNVMTSLELAESKHGMQVPLDVIAIREIKDDKVYSYGMGTYVGDFPRPGSDKPLTDEEEQFYRNLIESIDENPPVDLATFFEKRVLEGRLTQEEADEQIAQAKQRRELDRARPIEDRIRDAHLLVMRNPKIVLQNGHVVWGYECWWGPEQEMRDKVYRGRIITFVRPDRELEEPDEVHV